MRNYPVRFVRVIPSEVGVTDVPVRDTCRPGLREITELDWHGEYTKLDSTLHTKNNNPESKDPEENRIWKLVY